MAFSKARVASHQAYPRAREQDRPADTNTIDAWRAAAPAATGWTTRAVREVLVGAKEAATATLDQSDLGGQWHRTAELTLMSSEQRVVRGRNGGMGTLVADVHPLQSAGRVKDDTPVTQGTLPPEDGIVLNWATAYRCSKGCTSGRQALSPPAQSPRQWERYLPNPLLNAPECSASPAPLRHWGDTIREPAVFDEPLHIASYYWQSAGWDVKEE